MLTDEKIYQNKVQYLTLLSKLNIDLTKLSNYLENINFFEKPASTQFFRAYRGGLCQYALDIYCELKGLSEAYFPNRYKDEDLIKVALFQHIYRAELYEEYNRNQKNEATGQWEAVRAYRYKENRPTFGDLGFSSYMVARHFIDLTDEQIEAITQADSKDSYAGDIHDIMRNYPLVTLTKMANIAAMYLSDTETK